MSGFGIEELVGFVSMSGLRAFADENELELGVADALEELRRLEMCFEMKELLRRLSRLRTRLMIFVELLKRQLMLGL